MKKVAYVCGGGDDLSEVRLDGGEAVGDDFVDGIIPNLDLSVVEESQLEGDSSAVVLDESSVAEKSTAVEEQTETPVVVEASGEENLAESQTPAVATTSS